ncbi:MAG: methyltransferase [Spirochaetes bacterium]|nr:methyltransferase [Spirochaetota bacterium]
MSDILKLKIEGFSSGGEGAAKAAGKSIFVEGGLPGETAVCRITGDRGDWAQAEIVELLEASPDRVNAECPFYGTCGGCNLQHLSYPAQLAAKTLILKEAFWRIGGFGSVQPLPAPCTPWGYRNRMQFHAIRQFDRRFAGAPWGFKAKGSSQIIPAADCPVADTGIRALLRQGGKEAQAFFVSPEKDRVNVYSRGGLLLSEAGVARGKTRLLDRDIAVDAGVFFQSNGEMLERLISDLCQIAQGLPQAARSLPMADLYCGVGTFAAFLAGVFPAADLVEENKAALSLARENLRGVSNTRFFAKRAEDWAKSARLDGYGLIVADPPRQGLAASLAGRLAERGPAFLAYISCSPASLARDGKALSRCYDLLGLRFYDFYPQTAHIESLAIFARRASEPARQTHERDEPRKCLTQRH